MSCGNNIFNETTGNDNVYECGNIGGGIGLFSGETVTPTETTFNFKSLLAGPNINLTSTANEIEISSIDTGVTTLNNAGGGSSIGQSILGSTLNLRTLVGGSGITTTQNTDTVSIASNLTFTSGPGGVPIFTTGPPNAFFRSIAFGTGISTASTANTITITNTGVSSIANIGSGSGIASLPFVNPTLNLRSIRGLGSITATQTLDTIDLNSPVLTLTTVVAPGSTLIAAPFPNAQTKVLAAGTNMSLVNTATSITINNTMVPTNTVTNLPGGQPVLVDVLAGSVRARSISSSGSIAVANLGNTVNINGPVDVSIGSGTSVYRGLSGNNSQFASLTGTSNTTVSTDGSNIFIDTPIINTIPYSGKTILNTYLSGNPFESDFIGFGNNALVNLNDAFPADITTLPDAFIGWASPYRCQIIRVNSLIKFSIPTTVTEQVDIYCCIFGCKENDIGMNLIWFDMIFSTTSNISVGDYVQRTFEPNVDVDVSWTLYYVYFAHRPTGAGSTDIIEFYNSSSMTVRSSDTL
jgi:hypothetical protein